MNVVPRTSGWFRDVIIIIIIGTSGIINSRVRHHVTYPLNLRGSLGLKIISFVKAGGTSRLYVILEFAMTEFLK